MEKLRVHLIVYFSSNKLMADALPTHVICAKYNLFNLKNPTGIRVSFTNHSSPFKTQAKFYRTLSNPNVKLEQVF